MDQWTTYLIGGGGLALIGGLIWKLLDATVKGVQAENDRLGKRLIAIEADYDRLLARSRKSELDYSDLLAKHNLLAAEVAAAVPGVGVHLSA